MESQDTKLSMAGPFVLNPPYVALGVLEQRRAKPLVSISYRILDTH